MGPPEEILQLPHGIFRMSYFLQLDLWECHVLVILWLELRTTLSFELHTVVFSSHRMFPQVA